jgi:F420-dependent methylenetetrahydromethanopterin dehydrogenase
LAAALATGMKVTQMGPPTAARMPHWLLELMSRAMMAVEDRKAQADDVTMRMLAPTLRYDTQLIIESEDKLESFREIRADVLLMGGSASPPYLTAAVDALEGILPVMILGRMK